MYQVVFLGTFVLCVALQVGRYLSGALSGSKSARGHGEFRSFQINYLCVYVLGVVSDWLQGPYVYALYEDYGFGKKEIGQLFIAGFASSAVFGTFVASIADKFGRRSSVLVYALTYSICCATKHSPNFSVLLFGRIMAGIATSILFSAFESWMVYEHKSRGFDSEWISDTFSKAQFLNGCAAIASGQIAGFFAGKFGKVAPFDVAIADLLVLVLVVLTTWRENYGDARESISGGFKNAWARLASDTEIQVVGVAQSLFESSMFMFVFLWTPTIQSAQNLLEEQEIPHGLIFSTFMVSFMTGSSLSDKLLSFCSSESLLRHVFLVSVVCFVTCAHVSSLAMVYPCLILYEGLCGIYFPTIGTLRARYLPEETRSAIMNFYRVPLNVIVVTLLSLDLSLTVLWTIATALMSVAWAVQFKMVPAEKAKALENGDTELPSDTAA